MIRPPPVDPEWPVLSHRPARRILGVGWLLLFAMLALNHAAMAGVRISEFLTENDGGLRDGDGESPDWIEIQNDSPATVNLAGWHLTDSPTNLIKWTFPATNLPPAAYLIVFASGKDRAVSGAELHTNFRLDNGGGFLALVQPDGMIASAFTNYPAVRRNISFGIGSTNASATTLIAAGAAARWAIPDDDSVDGSWFLPAFDASTWFAANTPLRYDVTPGGTPGPPVLSIDVNDRSTNTAGTTQAGFSDFVIGAVGGDTAIQTGPITRIYGGISVTLSNSAAGIGYDDRFRTIPLNSGAFTLEDIFRDLIFSRENTGTSGLDVFIAGLAPAQTYQATVWSFDSGSSGNRISDWYANGVLVTNNYTFDGSVSPADDNAYRFSFQSAADGSGGFLISGRRDPASVDGSGNGLFSVFINALQLAPLSSAATTNGNLALMAGQNASVFVRLSFNVSAPATFNQLTLRVRYDDGFVAYLNGTQVASRNAPGAPAWNSTATGSHSASVIEDIVLPDAASLLVEGTNVLALHGLNVAANDSDFLLEPQLLATLNNEVANRFFSPPTPGAANGLGYEGLVADTKFSHDRGFYATNFSLSITCATAGAEIRYTLNGSRPSATNGFPLTTPIFITGQSFIRAAAFKSGLIPSDVDTHSYIFLRDVLRQSNNLPNYPTLWQASYPADYAMDSNIVNHPVYGASISNDLRGIPSLCIVSDHNGLWSAATGIYPNSTSAGDAWERETSLELIRGDGHTEFAEVCGVEVHGNASRDNVRTPKHSLRLTFKNDYGPTRLRYDWFGGGVDEHNGIVLRGCGFVDGWAGRYADNGLYTSSETGETFRGLRYRPENTCYLRDVWVKDSFRAMGWGASRSAFVHLYLNGLYWGLYEPSERLDATYFTLHYGGFENAWDVIVGEDNNGPPVLVDGSLADWQAVLNLVNAPVTSEAVYQAVAQSVDIENLIDYMMVHIFAESEDWPRHNWYVAHRRATNGLSGTKFICSVWDQELTLDRLVRRNRVDVGGTGGEIYGPARVYQQLRAYPEFRRQFGDRVHKHLFNGGALTPSNNVARLLGSAANIRDAVVGESARWGDARKNPTPGNTFGTGVTFTRDEWWQPEIDKLATNFLAKLTADNVARFRAGNLYPALGAPAYNQFGGAVPAGFNLTMTHTNASATIFFTVDGSDPRTYGTGAVGSTAQAYSEPVVLNTVTVVRARCFNASQWSALVDAIFFPPQDLSRLALTEVMFNPPTIGPADGDEFEFIELKNAGTNTLNLSGFRFTSGINFTFTNGTLLAPGQFFVLARNPASFAAKYPGVTIHGVYNGRLENGGETLTLSHALGATIFSVAYDDEAPWPVAADNFGFSIVPKFPGAAQAPDNGASWRASTNPGGSPGMDDPATSIPPIVINEVLTASTPPAVDTIELFNPTGTNVDIGGWFLTDNAGAPMKFRIPNGTNIPAGGFVVFDETQFNPMPGTNNSFSLSSHGESVYLFSGNANTNLTGYSHGFVFDAAPPGVSFGRHLNSVGDEQFAAQRALSFMAANAGPQVGPVVLNEIHYHPAPGEDEFIELQSISGAPMPLFDPMHATNTWRLNGLGYTFPTNVTIEPDGLLLLVATNPASFRAKYAVPTNVLILGPYLGALQDSGERLKLQRPDTPDTNGFAFITVDEVRYNDKAPWPPAADGSGPSLQRNDASAYGNDPINWRAAGPTPGQPNHTADTDGDGLPDDWEIANGTDWNVPDADADPDGDGMSNRQEFLAGTHPQQMGSSLKVDEITLNAGMVSLQFLAVSNRTYSVLFKNALEAPDWSKLADVSARDTNRVEVVVDSTEPFAKRFYRIVTPRWP